MERRDARALRSGDWVRAQVRGRPSRLACVIEVDASDQDPSGTVDLSAFVRVLVRYLHVDDAGLRARIYTAYRWPDELSAHTPTEDDLYTWSLAELAS